MTTNVECASLLKRIAQQANKTLKTDYNKSRFSKIGCQEQQEEKIEDTTEEILATCESFIASHEKDSEKDGVYVDDDAFPDSFNHASWNHNQMYDDKKQAYHQIAALPMIKKMKRLGFA